MGTGLSRPGFVWILAMEFVDKVLCVLQVCCRLPQAFVRSSFITHPLDKVYLWLLPLPVKPGVQNTTHFMLCFSFDFQQRWGWLGMPLEGVVMGWFQLGDMPYWVNVVHTDGELKNRCWACNSDNFEGTKVFVCKFVGGLCGLDKFCMQEDLVTNLQRWCRGPCSIRGGLHALLCDCEVLVEAGMDIREVSD